jgi:hypothetical protein
MSDNCANCGSLAAQLRMARQQLVDERLKRMQLDQGVDSVRAFGERELTTDEPTVRPRSKLSRVLVTRLQSLLDIVRS